MGHAQIAEQRYTVEEYFEMEEKSEIRHEFYDGEVFAMAGTTLNHNDIVDNVRSAFKGFFRPKGCRIFSENVKVKVSDIYYPYPDVVVTCSATDIAGTYIIKHPSILVEVLSKTSATYDRGFKLRRYKSIASLQYYMLVSQNEFYVELYSRSEETDIWLYRTFENADDVIRLNAFNFEMTLRSIYENIEFLPEEVI
nr:Uma2 family endonuclease [uncultured Dyadobacter sp.]